MDPVLIVSKNAGATGIIPHNADEHILIFPLGLTLPFVFKGSTVKRILLAILIGFALSAMIEALQYFFSLGQSEADDVICNTVGTAFGSCSYLLSLLWRKMTLKLRKEVKSDE
ncbi:VanZ family protein [Ruminococcus difficilis]|uniref:VanZ family protein n=1 Tax=Ruminococcus difficilis TaxID=2763069 RepID=A0A934WR34_9FIRM|nr:VanZ family protein [Ruminococcus difficilis]MBK6087652.1 VanZ family protein [Ruminococcus difficilis]